MDSGSTDLIAIERVVPDAHTSATEGEVRFAPLKALWFMGHGGIGIVGAIAFPQADAVVVFLLLTALTICAGHSVGMHRLLIHRSFETPRFVEYALVWLGVIVGMAGPLGMIRAHDMRDWHQRQRNCPPHPAHSAGFCRDAWWQLCCEFALRRPPEFVFEEKVASDSVYCVMERTWMAQQIPLALLLYAGGGWAWVFWGVSLRIFVSLAGHWMVGHFAHRSGEQGWRVEGVPVQGYDLPRVSLLTFGECWHGNHHAFPHSAKLGVAPGQLDLGFEFIKVLRRLGLARNVKLPGSEPPRRGLVRATTERATHRRALI